MKDYTPTMLTRARAPSRSQQAVSGGAARTARVWPLASGGKQGARRAAGRLARDTLARSPTNSVQVKATLYLKNRVALGPQTNLNAKVEIHARTSFDGTKLTEVEKRVEGRLELSQKLLNLTGTWCGASLRALTC